MMQNVINSVKRIHSTDKLNILTNCHGNEKYISLLCKSGHNFYIWDEVGGSQWNDLVEKRPSNLTTIAPQSRMVTCMDAIMCHDRTEQYDHISAIAQKLCLPIIIVDHCSKELIRPHNVLESVNAHVDVLQNRKADVVVSCDEASNDWHSGEALHVTIPTSVDLNRFKKETKRRDGNKFFESSLTPTRIGFDNNIPRPVGDTIFNGIVPSYSILPTDCDIEEKEVIYQTSNYFINPYKNITVKVIEAMATENVVISLDTVNTRQFFTDGIDGILVNSIHEIRGRIEELDNSETKRKEIGLAARKKVERIGEQGNFISKWEFVFDFIRNHFYQR